MPRVAAACGASWTTTHPRAVRRISAWEATGWTQLIHLTGWTAHAPSWYPPAMDRQAQIKLDRYQRIREQLAQELDKCDELITRMATAVALLHHKQTHFFWTGFYRLVQGQLLVGPYQGSLACQVIPPGQGVCGAAFSRGETVIVPDVHAFPGHIACDARSRAEIVVPCRSRGELVAVLDVDSERLGAFDATDAEQLEAVVGLVFEPRKP